MHPSMCLAKRWLSTASPSLHRLRQRDMAGRQAKPSRVARDAAVPRSEPGTRRAEHKAASAKPSRGAGCAAGQPPQPPFIASVNGMRLAPRPAALHRPTHEQAEGQALRHEAGVIRKAKLTSEKVWKFVAPVWIPLKPGRGGPRHASQAAEHEGLPLEAGHDLVLPEPRARSVPISWVRLATEAYMVFMAAKMAPTVRITVMRLPRIGWAGRPRLVGVVLGFGPTSNFSRLSWSTICAKPGTCSALRSRTRALENMVRL